MNLREQRNQILVEMRQIIDTAEAENRNLTEDEQSKYDVLMAQADDLASRIERQQKQDALEKSAAADKATVVPVHQRNQPAKADPPAVPAFNRTSLGDTEVRAYAHWLRTGDDGGIRELRASNDTDMNTTTPADGGYAVPTGHYQGIIARRDESMLASQLGVMLIPGSGTTVNVPLDGEADGEFVATNQASDHDRDAPAVGQKAMTLVKYTKKIELSYELLEDEDSQLLTFLNDFVGRGMAKTHNSLLLTEVGSNGTAFKTFAGTSAIAAGEPEDIVGSNDLSAYLDDETGVAWVMRSASYWDIASITGNDRLYAGGPSGEGKTLLGYPVLYSNKAAAIGGGNKSVYFGNWNFVGYREAPGFTVLRDPYSLAYKGQVVFHYYFRTVYGVLQAEAVGYGVHPTA